MQYDGLDRLTRLTSAGFGVSKYTYDPLGNVRSRQSSGVTTTFTYDATKNRIASQSGSVPWSYDDRGNVTQIGGFGFTWNRANEVTADTLGTTFAYDAHGWRVKQHVTAGGTHTRYFVYDASHRLIERLDNGTATDFVYVGSKPIARRTGSTTTYVHGDEQNSPLFETSSAGAITRQPVYLGYGESDTVGIAEIPGYAGSAPDKETGINYMGARYYYAYVGRFLSPDPAELNPTTHIGLNRYAYANDNPVRFTDPDGRQSIGMFGLTSDQLRSLGTKSMVQTRLNAAEEFVSPKSISIELSGAVSGGSPVIGGAAQLSAGITLGKGAEGGAAASVYTSGGIEATSAIKEVGTVSYPLGGDGANIGGSAGRGAALSISNAPVSTAGGTSVVNSISTPIGGVSWSSGSNGIWSAGISGPSEGLSYSKITVETKVIVSTECRTPCN